MEDKKYCIFDKNGVELCVCRHRPCKQLKRKEQECEQYKCKIEFMEGYIKTVKTARDEFEQELQKYKTYKELEEFLKKHSNSTEKSIKQELFEAESHIKKLNYELVHLKFGDKYIPHCFGRTLEGILEIIESSEKLKQSEVRVKELEENIKTIFKTLIIANDFNIGAIQDTIWVDKYTTLWDYIRIILNMNDEQFEEFEKQALEQIESEINNEN